MNPPERDIKILRKAVHSKVKIVQEKQKLQFEIDGKEHFIRVFGINMISIGSFPSARVYAESENVRCQWVSEDS